MITTVIDNNPDVGNDDVISLIYMFVLHVISGNFLPIFTFLTVVYKLCSDLFRMDLLQRHHPDRMTSSRGLFRMMSNHLIVSALWGSFRTPRLDFIAEV